MYLNGSAIKQALPEKLNKIMGDVRNLLISKPNATTKCKVWLLLAVEVANHRFGVLPADLQEFYQHQLGDKAMAYFQVCHTQKKEYSFFLFSCFHLIFQGSHYILSVQTVHTSKALDGFQSNVNVLQVSTPEVSPASELSYFDNTNQGSQQFYGIFYSVNIVILLNKKRCRL